MIRVGKCVAHFLGAQEFCGPPEGMGVELGTKERHTVGWLPKMIWRVMAGPESCPKSCNLLRLVESLNANICILKNNH